MEVLNTISDVLHTKGEPCDFGCKEADLEFLKRQVEKENPTKAKRAVKNWSLWDIEVNDAEAEVLHSSGLSPLMLYASNVIWDSSGKFDPGSYVRSTLLVTFPDHFLCETRNTIYILVGTGSRKKVSPSTALSIVFENDHLPV